MKPAGKNPFHFYTRLHLIFLLGTRARTVEELRAGIANAPLSAIYHHTHRYLHQQKFLYPEPPNDFAYWLANTLNLDALAEALASVNIIRFQTLEGLKRQLVQILTDYVARERPAAVCPEGQEFHFMKCRSFILPTSHVAHDVKEFSELLGKISVSSLYYHMIEAKLRLERDQNDFSAWLSGIGENELAERIARLDPYNITLDGLRRKVIDLVQKYARH
jgi:hypothetical protein